MSTPLSFYPRPPVHTRCGMHDSNDAGANPPDDRAHAKALRARGITSYKLLDDPVLEASARQVQRAKVYWQHGIMPIIRLYKSQPHPHWKPDPRHVSVYTGALGSTGNPVAPYIEAGNEWNLSTERSRNATPAEIAVQFREAAHNIKQGGGIPLVYALSPGGDMYAGDHRRAYREFLDELLRLGGKSALDGCAIALHPRPHTFPPDTPPSATATVTFNEWQWYATEIKTRFGWNPPMIFTEHGYSLNDATNTGHPPITEAVWTAYNEELFRRGDPNHSQSLPPYVFFQCYWKEIGPRWFDDNAFNSWCPNGATAWGRRIGNMGINWHYSLTQNVPLRDLLIAEAKNVQLISPNKDAALEKKAHAEGYTTALGNEYQLTQNGVRYVAQLFYRHAGAQSTEAVYYVEYGQWGNPANIKRVIV